MLLAYRQISLLKSVRPTYQFIKEDNYKDRRSNGASLSLQFSELLREIKKYRSNILRIMLYDILGGVK